MVSISRVSRDGNSVILKSSTGYEVLSLNSPESTSGTFEALIASGSWRRPTKDDAKTFASLVEIADGAIVASASQAPKKPRLYRAPKNVREEISAALKEFSALISDQDREVAKRISQGPVAKDDIEWMYTFFSQIDKAEKLRGGKYGRRWAEKVCSVQDPLTASVAPFDEDDLYYYGISDTEGSDNIQALLAVDPRTQELYDWVNGKWELSAGESISDVDEPYILPLDGETAAKVATWINQNPVDQPEGYNVYTSNHVERNLYELAASEIDFGQLNQIAAVIADATGYSTPERSVNAKRQNRGPGGKFGGGGADGGANPPSKKLTTFNKARLPQELPLVENVADRINEWLGQEVITAAGDEPAMYFAIVDEVDKTAVMDAVAIRKTAENLPEAFLRKGGEWVKDEATLANLRGATPPPVVELDDTETVKTVLAQIDEHDGKSGEVADDVSSSEQIQNLSVGFELPDGSFSIKSVDDLQESLTLFSFVEPTTEEKAHVRKRAYALNRPDLLPSEWRNITTVERGLTAAAVSPLMGEFGEILAAGAQGIADTPGDFAAVRRLKNYWMRGAGAAKIRWGTPGDLTRAYRHLLKYLKNSGHAWGMAQNMHKELFGVPNTTHDKATGQYKSRRGKR
jgi:hypothetical protein